MSASIAPRKPYVAPTQVRLMGTDIDVAHAIEILHAVFTITTISSTHPLTGREVLVIATITRQAPYSGGAK